MTKKCVIIVPNLKLNSTYILCSTMSRTLMIRHLPTSLSFQDKEQLLKHFGAENVWETTKKRDYVFASFSSVEKAKSSLMRLHQLEIARRRLVVEYSFEKEPILIEKYSDTCSTTTKNIKEFIKLMNAWNPSVNFYQPPSIYTKYEYPDVSTNVAVNILYCLFHHKPFYVQVLHLMNKMSLDNPFNENHKAIEYFREKFKDIFTEFLRIPLPDSEQESELSSDEAEQKSQPVAKLLKRKNNLPLTRKTSSMVFSSAKLPKIKKTTVRQEEVFETITPIVEQKKISLVVHENALQKPMEDVPIVGELGKFQKEEQQNQEKEKSVEPELPTITRKELMKNRISYSDMKILPVFKNYHPGQPSMRLYVKNLAKIVTEQDIKSIYKRYVETNSDDDQTGFDVRVMQEGRMKGQAFVTFPSVKVAEIALHETNGYILKDKPMVVQFARVACKKPVD